MLWSSGDQLATGKNYVLQDSQGLASFLYSGYIAELGMEVVVAMPACILDELW